MEASERTLWIGRAVEDGVAKTLRAVTDGHAPRDGDEAEVIEDPFADPGAEVWTVAREAVAKARFPLGAGGREQTAPVRARKVIGVGRNYRAHAEELGNVVPESPLLFFKAPTCLIGTGQPIPLPRGYERVDMEAELVVVLGKRAKSVAAKDAWQYVAGYALGNDISNRDLQKRDKQWTRAKGFDGFGPVGPFLRLTPPGFVLPVDRLRIKGYLNDALVQDACLADMIFDLPTLIEHITECMTLEPGDLIYTGTPAGVSPLQPGDACRVELDGMDLGVLSNPVA